MVASVILQRDLIYSRLASITLKVVLITTILRAGPAGPKRQAFGKGFFSTQSATCPCSPGQRSRRRTIYSKPKGNPSLSIMHACEGLRGKRSCASGLLRMRSLNIKGWEFSEFGSGVVDEDVQPWIRTTPSHSQLIRTLVRGRGCASMKVAAASLAGHFSSEHQRASTPNSYIRYYHSTTLNVGDKY